MTLKQFKGKYLREGARLGYKKALREMALSPSFNKDNYYSGIKNSYNKEMEDYESEYKRRREKLLQDLENEYKTTTKKKQDRYASSINISKILEKFAEAMPCVIGDIKADYDGGELIVNDKNCPIEKILVKYDYYDKSKVEFRFMEYKKHMYASARGEKLKPEYQEISRLADACDSYTINASLESMNVEDAISTVSNALTNMMNVYKEAKQNDPSINANLAKGTLTAQEVRDMLINGKHSSWMGDIFAYLNNNDIKEFLSNLAELINDDFNGNPSQAILNADNWFTVAEEAVYEEGDGDYEEGIAIIEKEERAEEFNYFDGTYIFVLKKALRLK